MIVRRPRLRGLGLDYYGLLAQAGLENCDPRDSACVSNNVAKQAAVEDLWVSKYMTNPNGAPNDLRLTFTPQTQAQVDEFYSGTNPFSGGNVVDTRGIMSASTGGSTPVNVGPGVPATAVALRVGQLSFTTSRGGTALQVGDSWRISIAGASPNIQVSVKGGKNGAADMAAMGTTDASGNFAVLGVFTADQVGSWSETWYVGSGVAGSFSFTVSPSTTPGGATIINSGGVPSQPDPSAFNASSFPSIPLLGWVAIVGIGLYVFGGRR